MKKILFSLFVFSFLLVGLKVSASTLPNSLEVTLKMGEEKSVVLGGQELSMELKTLDDETGIYSLEINGVVKRAASFGTELIFTDKLSTKGISYGTILSGTQSVTLQILEKSNFLISIISPNGGESYKVGDVFPINWTSDFNSGESVTLSLIDNSYTCGMSTPGCRYETNIALNVADIGSYNWHTDLVRPGNMYRVKACIGLTDSCGYSNKYFKITSSTLVDDSKDSNEVKHQDENQFEVKHQNDELKDTNNGCRSGFKFNPSTGAACPTETVNDGCRPGFKFSPMTGLACPEVAATASSDNTYSSNDYSNKVSIKRTLKVGTKGDDVKIIQALLGLIADGAFGPATKAKVMEWQAAQGLTADGAFGSMSRQKAGLED